jgi:hypothetical protein
MMLNRCDMSPQNRKAFMLIHFFLDSSPNTTLDANWIVQCAKILLFSSAEPCGTWYYLVVPRRAKRERPRSFLKKRGVSKFIIVFI